VATRLNDTFAAYLVRLGVEPEPPSAEALARLHRAHVERIPWETVWVHLGEGWSIDPATSVARIAQLGRGGYCYHLNGAFSELLAALGYDVTRHVGAVHGPGGASEAEIANHLVLTVHGLPTSDHPDGTWYVDAGLGDALHEPVPLRPMTHEQGPFRYVLADTPGAIGDWHFTHDPAAGSFTGMAWRAAPVGMDTFAAKHRWLLTSPDSRFRQVMTAQRRDATGVDVLRGKVLQRIGDVPSRTVLEHRNDLVDVLDGIFGIDVASIDGVLFDALWERILRAHEAWLAGQAPAAAEG
jgi:arylamine N-acetyltransferase